MAEDEIRIGVSSCLLGQEVRFDGGHKHHRFLTDMLARYVTFVPVCPELGAGLGIPRESIRLVAVGDDIRLRGTRSATDHTDAMRTFSETTADWLQGQDLSGYVFKKDSPSCGLFRVKIYQDSGMATRDGRGLYAETVTRHFPDLPVEEEGRLNDARIRDNFIERMFAFHRLRRFLAGNWTPGDMVAFHSREKLLLMAHSPKAYQDLGRLVADCKAHPRDQFARQYRAIFMEAMGKMATPGRQTNVLSHMAGYFKKQADDATRAELAALIEDFRQGLVPLIVPVTLIKHLVRRFDVAYLADQTYLNPHPREMMLRNHV